MKTLTRTGLNPPLKSTFTSRPLALGHEALRRIGELKTKILSDFHGEIEEQRRLVRLALNEAEALARQTDYPHLLFPALAAEKVQAVVDWRERQRRMMPLHEPLAFAA